MGKGENRMMTLEIQHIDKLKQRLARIEARIKVLEEQWEQTDYLKSYFPLDTGGRRPGWEKRLDRSFKLAKELSRLYRERDNLLDAIRGVERAAKEAEARRHIEKMLRACKPGDELIDAIYGRVTVVRVNKKTITVRTPSGYQEARPFSMLLPLEAVTLPTGAGRNAGGEQDASTICDPKRPRHLPSDQRAVP